MKTSFGGALNLLVGWPLFATTCSGVMPSVIATVPEGAVAAAAAGAACWASHAAGASTASASAVTCFSTSAPCLSFLIQLGCTIRINSRCRRRIRSLLGLGYCCRRRSGKPTLSRVILHLRHALVNRGHQLVLHLLQVGDVNSNRVALRTVCLLARKHIQVGGCGVNRRSGWKKSVRLPRSTRNLGLPKPR